MLALASHALAIVPGQTDTSEFSTPGSKWNGMNWDYVGQVRSGSCVAVAGRYVLTNRHFAISVGNTVAMDGAGYTVQEMINAPAFEGQTPDLRLLKVSQALPGHYDLYSGSLNTHDDMIVVGTGYSGTVNAGDSTYTFPDGTSRQKRWGTNEYSGTVVLGGTYTSNGFSMGFDYGDTQYECGLASGDSGGGVFYEVSNGVWQLAGLGASVGNRSGTYPPYDISYAIKMGPLYAGWINDASVLLGDFDGDDYVDADDIDLLCANVGNSAYDLDGDSDADVDDLIYLVESLVDLQDGSGRIGTMRGDYNLDGYVDGTDLAIFKAGFGLSGAVWSGGDLNCDGFVDATDLAIFKANFGYAAPGSPVPEPATLGLLALGAAALIRRRKR
jgi:hypothetical protein